MPTIIVPITILMLLVAGLTGCSGGPSTSATKTTLAACAEASSPDPATPVVAILEQLGQHDAATAEANRQAVEKVIAGSEKLEANLMVNGVSGQISPPNLLVDTHMASSGKNNLRKKKDLECKRAAIRRAANKLRAAPASEKLDLLSALRTLKRDLDGSKATEIHVVVLAPTLQTETINLANGETLDNPAQAINLLAAKQLNFRCRGWRVYLITDNRRARRPVTDSEDVKLKAWWSAYIKRCGGNLVTYNNELVRFPLVAQTTEGADSRRMPVDVERTRRSIVVTVGGDLLFATGSSVLRPGAEQGLDRVLALLGEAMGPVTVTGYTDSTANAEINKPLSRDRAQTVADWLTERAGLPADRLRVRGHGSTDPVASNATEAGRAKNRRVVVTIRKKP